VIAGNGTANRARRSALASESEKPGVATRQARGDARATETDNSAIGISKRNFDKKPNIFLT